MYNGILHVHVNTSDLKYNVQKMSQKLYNEFRGKKWAKFQTNAQKSPKGHFIQEIW